VPRAQQTILCFFLSVRFGNFFMRQKSSNIATDVDDVADRDELKYVSK